MGSDHAGFSLRQSLAEYARQQGHDVSELGAGGTDAYDYPEASDAVVARVLEDGANTGVLICGTGIGVSIRANRYPGIRAAVCCSPETAKLARMHNHANILCLGARTTTPDTARQILQVFLETGPDLAERHVRRVSKLDSAKI